MPVLGALEQLIARRYFIDSGADEIHRVRCPDGVRVSVKRFHPPGGADHKALPVLCIPGLGADSHNFDAPAPSGFATYLAEQGFDTWVVDLRGTGLSDVERERWSDITFDDLVHQDLVSVIEHVLESSGKEQLHLVGHSMGGMLIYATLGTTRVASQVRSAVALCAPVGFAQGLHFPRAIRPLLKIGDYIPGIHAGRLMRLTAPLLLRRGSRGFTAHLAPSDNVDERYVRRVAHRTVQDVPRGLLLQFRDWVTKDRFCSKDGRLDYRARMAGITTPTLVVAAPKDKMASPRSVMRARELLANADVMVCSERQGFSTDYGHIDVIFGRRAHDEIFPRLSRFLIEHDAAPVAAPDAPWAARVH